MGSSEFVEKKSWSYWKRESRTDWLLSSGCGDVEPRTLLVSSKNLSANALGWSESRFNGEAAGREDTSEW